MKLHRRSVLYGAAGAIMTLLVRSPIARAQAYPTRPVHLIVGFPAGFTPDIIARLTAQSLSERLGQQVIVDNRPGAASNIGTELVVRALPDGYTLLGATGANAINATLFENLNFNLMRDIAPVASVVRAPLVMTVNPSVPANTVSEFIAYAKSNPGKLNMASGGVGSTPHVAGELFKMAAGVNLVHVPYRISNMPDLLAGQVQVLFAPVPTVIGYIRAGRLRALAVTSTQHACKCYRTPRPWPNSCPVMKAARGSASPHPRRPPLEIVDKLNNEVNACLSDPKLLAQLADLGSVPTSMSPADFSKLIANEIDKWAKVIKTADIKPE
jgi:tripartite-type tricarboxylate transporter receptor subunit TctC